jgi:tetratricopeptide (TPR) repeat protein
MRSRVADHGTDTELNISAYSEADELYRAGRFREALKLFKVSSAADLTDGDAFHAIGSCYDALGKPGLAAKAYRSAVKLLPVTRHPELHFNIGNAFFDLGQYAEALAEYRLVPIDCSVWPAASKNSNRALEMIGNEG